MIRVWGLIVLIALYSCSQGRGSGTQIASEDEGSQPGTDITEGDADQGRLGDVASGVGPTSSLPVGGIRRGRRLGLKWVTGVEEPIFITHAGDARLFIVERAGRIRILQHDTLRTPPFLDITSLVSRAGERGLLSMAFHPNYQTPGSAGAGLFWVNYSNHQGATVIARYAVSTDDPHQADPDTGLVLLTIEQPFANHNGGQIQFGPVEGIEQKRYLYIGMGDGGSGGDPGNRAQTDTTLLGKMLRLDPRTDATPAPPFYTIPPDNPDATAGRPLGSIWAKGLRNPWRFSFDAGTGDLYIADVGQNRFEEVNVTAAGTSGGLNYGWRVMEGRHCFDPPSDCDRRDLVLPVVEYGRGRGRCAIIGGYVYRGANVPTLTGTYLYADYCSGEIFGLNQVSPGLWESTLLQTRVRQPLTFGQDVNHELYLGSEAGNVYQIVTPE